MLEEIEEILKKRLFNFISNEKSSFCCIKWYLNGRTLSSRRLTATQKQQAKTWSQILQHFSLHYLGDGDGDGDGGGGFFLTCKDLARPFNHSFPAIAFFSFF